MLLEDINDLDMRPYFMFRTHVVDSNLVINMMDLKAHSKEIEAHTGNSMSKYYQLANMFCSTIRELNNSFIHITHSTSDDMFYYNFFTDEDSVRGFFNRTSIPYVEQYCFNIHKYIEYDNFCINSQE